MAQWTNQRSTPFMGNPDHPHQPSNQEQPRQQQYGNAGQYDFSALTTLPWRQRLAQQPERAPWSSQLGDVSGNDSPGVPPVEPFPDLPEDVSAWELDYGSGQTTAKPSPRHSPSTEVSFTWHASGEATARPSRHQSPIEDLGNVGDGISLSTAANRLGPEWPSSYHPLCDRPWHYQHPSLVDNHYLLQTCDKCESIFPQSPNVFVPENTPWFTHWLIAFCIQKTGLKNVEICMVYRYKYRDVIPGIQYMKEQHIAKLWDYLRQGEHAYAFEWERNEGFVSSLRALLDVWCSEACRPKEWQREERRFQYHKVLNGADF